MFEKTTRVLLQFPVLCFGQLGYHTPLLDGEEMVQPDSVSRVRLKGVAVSFQFYTSSFWTGEQMQIKSTLLTFLN